MTVALSALEFRPGEGENVRRPKLARMLSELVTATAVTSDPTILALKAFNSDGIMVQTAADTFTSRSLSAPAAGLTITNPAGIAGNPTFALANDLAALEGLGSTGIAVRTGADTWAQRTIGAGSSKISVSNGDGVSDNPTVDLGTVAIADITDLQSTLDAKQPLDADLTALAALTTTAYGRSVLETADAAALRTLAGLVIGTDVQAYDADLAALAGLTSSADKVPYFTGSGTAAVADFTSFARSMLDDADATAVRSTLGLGTAATQSTGTSGTVVPLLDGANTHSGASTFSSTVRLTVTNDVTLASTNHAFQIGADNGANLAMDQNEIQARNNGATNTLNLNLEGGSVALCAGMATVSSTGLDVAGESRCNSFRIDAAPSASAATTTHKLAISCNGTTYYLLLSNV